MLCSAAGMPQLQHHPPLLASSLPHGPPRESFPRLLCLVRYSHSNHFLLLVLTFPLAWLPPGRCGRNLVA